MWYIGLSASFPALKSTLKQREDEDEWIRGISTQSNENNSKNRQNTPQKNKC